MHTHDLENHDNLYAEEVPTHGHVSAMEARSHVLAGVAAIGHGGPLG